MSSQGLNPTLSFFKNQIRDEYGVDSGLFRLIGQPIQPELQQRIEIAEEYDGYIDALSCARHACERVLHCYAITQGTFRCTLNHFPISDWITERDTELNDVRTRRR